MRVDAPLKCLIIGTPGEVRVMGFQAALQEGGHPPAEVIGYPRWVLLSDDERSEALHTYDRVRVESPGRDPKALHAIRWREQQPDKPIPTEPNHTIGDSWGWGLSLSAAIGHTASSPNEGKAVYLNDPEQIIFASDKPWTNQHLDCHGVPVPKQLFSLLHGEGCGYDQVREAMQIKGINRVFIKLRYGYSGSGVVAYQVGKDRELAITTVAMKQSPEGMQLLNTRKIQRYQARQDIRQLLDTLCPLGVYLERWVPKASVNDRTTDLRVVTIAGRVRHIVMRMSKHPITNLHLLNERCSPEPLQEQMRQSDWDSMLETCERVARYFHKMLYLGIDVAVHADLRRHSVIEVNAWGDLLHGVTDQGQSTYEAEVQAMRDWGGSLD